jgi:hypothetical protein
MQGGTHVDLNRGVPLSAIHETGTSELSGMSLIAAILLVMVASRSLAHAAQLSGNRDTMGISWESK